ncbi:MAG: hypothetical protein J4215_04885 [Candidatus Diapherotrites archaeon]|uniref:Uncharacterized protein n=1 Tax=Candidatus Iainarchaeum sp. TaxID=3101447 RepID=A0A8T4L3I4_9ARCH|nr:hypothetical protein [Candidatus Diapherotrites archaeon]
MIRKTVNRIKRLVGVVRRASARERVLSNRKKQSDEMERQLKRSEQSLARVRQFPSSARIVDALIELDALYRFAVQRKRLAQSKKNVSRQREAQEIMDLAISRQEILKKIFKRLAKP